MGVMDDDEERRADDLIRQSKVSVRSRNFEFWSRRADDECPIGNDSLVELLLLFDGKNSTRGGGRGGGGDGGVLGFVGLVISFGLYEFHDNKTYN